MSNERDDDDDDDDEDPPEPSEPHEPIETGASFSLARTIAAESLGATAVARQAPSGVQLTASTSGGDPAARPDFEGEGPRYVDRGLLGAGGMGEVRRVADLRLGRVVAMKILAPRPGLSTRQQLRFLEEARVTAQLQHPDIVPVHDLGVLPDGQLYFTMREVRGRPLSEVIAGVHAASRGARWEAAPDGWTFQRLIQVVWRVCNAVAYAHGRGVLHRDLKPSNVMVGEHGEVQVVDWGIARVLEATDAGDTDTDTETDTVAPIDSLRSQRHDETAVDLTHGGAIAGTPAYMAPEQARGAAVDVRTDVYGLGTLLYEVLAGHPPYEGDSSVAVIYKVLGGALEPPRPRRAAHEPVPPLPDALVGLCTTALAADPHQRHPDAAALAAGIEAWLDGASRRARARGILDTALERLPRVEQLRAEAQRCRDEAEALLRDVPLWAPEALKAPGWARADRGLALEREAEAVRNTIERELHAALGQCAEMHEAHAALVELYRAQHAEAEARAELALVDRAGELMRTHAEALPAGEPLRGAALEYLRGDGVVTLLSEPAGATLELARFELEHRRLVARPLGTLGQTPLHAHTLPMGSYLVTVLHPDCEPVRYPVALSRCGRWHAVAPGESTPRPIVLPPRGALDAHDCYVPAGWFASGGDPEAPGADPARPVWCEGFVMRRFPVTNREYIAFLDDLVAQGREADALAQVPRERIGAAGAQSALIYGRRADGGFALQPDADGDLWHLDWPVVMIDWWAAWAYADWYAARTGLPWRLPAELEWEKAARGVDGRAFPWGDAFDPSWCCMRDSHAGRPLPSTVDGFPVDESVYGVRGLGGNTYDWCLDRFEAGTLPPVDGGRARIGPLEREAVPLRAHRGGAVGTYANYSRAAHRGSRAPHARAYNLGLRLVRSL